mgnify:CR=1 FL=1
MNCHQSNVFLQDLSNSFIIGSTFYSSFRSASTIHGVSHRHSRILKTEEEFLLNPYPFFHRFMVQAWCHPLIIVLDCENSFHPSDAFRGLLSFLDHPKAIISEDLSILNWCLFVRLHILPVLRSSILQSVRDLFVLLYLNPLKYLHSFSNSSRWIVPLLLSF